MILNRGQIGTEYLIVVGFVLFIIMTTLGIAFFYTTSIQDSIKINQMEKAAKKIVDSAETTFYNGNGALSTTEVYFPEGLLNAEVFPKEIAFTLSTQSGININSYPSAVPLSGSLQPTPSGIRKVRFIANTTSVNVTLLQ